ncbi:MAG: hypothetical protein J6V25_07050, partial [Oscillospiraceae bacterium]|nr:hypothetical protein [Oscillospiraceae bacterium]
APAAPVATQASVMEAPPAEAPPATEAAPATEAPASPAPSSQNAEMGSTISTDFVEITLTNLLVAEDIKHSVKSGHITYTTGPEPVAGQKYICISGTIRNTSNAPLPVYDFFLGDFELDGYHYQVDATDCDILDGEGSPVTNIDPLMEYTIRIYVAIPNSLADNHGSCIFSFGFFDHFDNQELAYNRSFAEDPIALCPYRYTLTLK